MTNRFMISVAAAALIAGTGFANAQGAGDARRAAVPPPSRARRLNVLHHLRLRRRQRLR